MSLSQYALREVKDVLDQSIFTSSAFFVDSTYEDEAALLQVSFKENTSLRIMIEREGAVPWDADNKPSIKVTQSPAGVFQSGVNSFSYLSQEQLLHTIKTCVVNWLADLEKELGAEDALTKQLEDWQEKITRDLEGKLSASEHFTNEEALNVRRRLDELEALYANMEKAHTATKAELDQLRKTITELKGSIGKIPKKTWTRAFIRRVGDFAFKWATSEHGQKVLMERAEQVVYYLDAATKHLLNPPQ